MKSLLSLQRPVVSGSCVLHTQLEYNQRESVMKLFYNQQAELVAFFKSQLKGSPETRCGQTIRETKTLHTPSRPSFLSFIQTHCVKASESHILEVNYTELMLLKHIYHNTEAPQGTRSHLNTVLNPLNMSELKRSAPICQKHSVKINADVEYIFSPCSAVCLPRLSERCINGNTICLHFFRAILFKSKQISFRLDISTRVF